MIFRTAAAMSSSPARVITTLFAIFIKQALIYGNPYLINPEYSLFYVHNISMFGQNARLL
jgi:hypothetical protein